MRLVSHYVCGGRMKPLNKRLNKRKASKVTLKNHRKSSHPPLQDEIKEAADGVSSVRPEDIKIHQHY
jgi:tRNA(Phe) wybutosine-synthesizing methylase Tyw3